MTTQDQRNGVNPLTVGMAGVIVGGAMGAAAVALSDKKNRTEAIKKLSLAKDSLNKWSDKVAARTQKFSEKTKASLNGKADELEEKVEERVLDIKEQTAAE